MLRTIQVRTSFEGIHRYSGAPDEVSFLSAPHRHMFGVCVEVEVFHDDREVEFIMLKHRIDLWLKIERGDEAVWQMGELSCEQVATSILEYVQSILAGRERFIKVTVDEDGENGACVAEKFDKGRRERSCNKHDAVKIDVMSFGEYQSKAYKAIQSHSSNKEEVMHWAIGLGEEAGEALSVVKHKYYGGQYSVEEMVDELGDVLWHIASLCTALGIDMDDVAKYNMAKLNFRYPSDTFDESRSQARHELSKDFSTSEERIAIVSRIKSKVENKTKETSEE